MCQAHLKQEHFEIHGLLDHLRLQKGKRGGPKYNKGEMLLGVERHYAIAEEMRERGLEHSNHLDMKKLVPRKRSMPYIYDLHLLLVRSWVRQCEDCRQLKNSIGIMIRREKERKL